MPYKSLEYGGEYLPGLWLAFNFLVNEFGFFNPVKVYGLFNIFACGDDPGQDSSQQDYKENNNVCVWDLAFHIPKIVKKE